MATLTQIVERLLETSGRQDLDANDGDGVKKAWHVINAAQRELDLKMAPPKNELRYVGLLAAGDIAEQVQYLRSIEEVWVDGEDTTSTDKRTRLVQVQLHKLREKYNKSDPTLIDRGRPNEYALDVIGLSTEQEATTDLTSFSDVGTMKTGDHWNYNGLLMYPPADAAYTIQIYGTFWTYPLANNTDTSYWTMLHEECLIWMCNYILEVRKRNSTGAADWLRSIERYLGNLDKDFTDREMSHNQLTMKG